MICRFTDPPNFLPRAFWVFFKTAGQVARHFEKYPEGPGDEVATRQLSCTLLSTLRRAPSSTFNMFKISAVVDESFTPLLNGSCQHSWSLVLICPSAWELNKAHIQIWSLFKLKLSYNHHTHLTPGLIVN